VTVLWEFLDKTHIQLWKNISHTNAELDALTVKVVCLQKTLDQTDHYTFKKADCFVTELDSDNNETENKIISFNIQQLIDSMSSIFWNLILFFSQNIKAFSHSS